MKPTANSKDRSQANETSKNKKELPEVKTPDKTDQHSPKEGHTGDNATTVAKEPTPAKE